MKWGERKLEDNWRRSNKQVATDLLDENGNTAESDSAGTGTVILDNKSREFYLMNIPLTDSAMEISHGKLEEALYNMGMIYRNDLLDYERAIEALEALVTRYPSGSFTMESYYYLHDLHNSVQNPAKAEEYKGLLSRRYPESHMAKLLTNPNYINELEAEQQLIEDFYIGVYNDFLNDNHVSVVRKATSGIEEYKDDEDLLARLTFLKALSTGALNGEEAMKTELDTLIAQFPGTEIALEAQEIIDYMYVAFPEVKVADQVKEAEALYTYDPAAPHKFLLALDRSENLNLVNFNLLNYNLDNFNEYDLEIELQELDVDYNLLVVGEFSDMDGVNRYTERIRTDIFEIMGEIPQDAYEVVIISSDNYVKLLKAKEVKPYLLFFREKYQQ
jgi:TolA-binding protein